MEYVVKIVQRKPNNSLFFTEWKDGAPVGAKDKKGGEVFKSKEDAEKVITSIKNNPNWDHLICNVMPVK